MKKQNSQDGWKGFLSLCSEIESPAALDQFFELLLTYEERETLASRYLIIKALLEGGLTQREISEIFKVSIAQITRGSNALKIISPQLKNSLLSKLQKIK